MADVACRQQTVIAYGEDLATVQRVAAQFARAIDAQRDRFIEARLAPVAAVDETLRRVAAEPGLPVVLCDTDDNPGAGAASDKTAILRSLVAHDVDRKNHA